MGPGSHVSPGVLTKLVVFSQSVGYPEAGLPRWMLCFRPPSGLLRKTKGDRLARDLHVVRPLALEDVAVAILGHQLPRQLPAIVDHL